MTTYTWPAAIIPKRQRLQIVPSVRVFTSPYSQQMQALDLMSEVWKMQIDLPDGVSPIVGGQIEALFDRLKGQANLMTLWSFQRPLPQGTMRGTPTLSALAAQFANTLSIATTASATLLAGDMIGVGGQLFRVMADAVADGTGAMTVEVAPRVRASSIASGSVVIWSQPTVTMRLTSDGAPVDWMPGNYAGPKVEFIEAL